MGSIEEHTKLVNDALIALGRRPDLGKFFKRNTGELETPKGGRLKYGIVGGADIEGILNTGFGTHGEFEAKTGKAKQSEEQINFEIQVNRYKGFYYVFRDVSDLIKKIETFLQSYNNKS